jgi:ubiquinone/menaquinone biosynthesis C-methylase UbiE
MLNSIDTYKLFAEYYDLYAGNYSDDLELYKSVCNNNDRIIEIGCGTGRVLKYLLQSGFSITGVDISYEMMNIAKLKLKEYLELKKLILLNHNFYNGNLEKKYDRALVTFYTFNYIINDPCVFLKNIYKTLNAKAVLMMDLFYPQSLIDKSIENKWRQHVFEINSRKVNLKDKRWVENNIEHRIQIYQENNMEIQINTERKYYSPSEIKNLLKEAGFKNIQFSLTFQIEQFVEQIEEKDLVKNFLVKAEKD